MIATFVITHGNSSRASRPLNEAVQALQALYGKEAYVQIGVREENLEKTIRSLGVTSKIVSIEDKTIEIGPYLVLYKLIKTS